MASSSRETIVETEEALSAALKMDADAVAALRKRLSGASPFKVVSVESPFRPSNGQTQATNIAYATAAVKHSSLQGEAGYASHLLLTRMLFADGSSGFVSDDVVEPFGADVDQCIAMTHAMRLRADAIVLYIDLGLTGGMKAAIEAITKHNTASDRHIAIAFRRLPAEMMEMLQRGMTAAERAAAATATAAADKFLRLRGSEVV